MKSLLKINFLPHYLVMPQPERAPRFQPPAADPEPELAGEVLDPAAEFKRVGVQLGSIIEFETVPGDWEVISFGIVEAGAWRNQPYAVVKNKAGEERVVMRDDFKLA